MTILIYFIQQRQDHVALVFT